MPLVRALLIGVVLIVGLLVLRPVQRLLALAGRSPGLAIVLFCRTLLALLGVRVVVAGRPGQEARLIVANHVSWIDVLALASVEPACFLAKSEVAAWPLIGRLAIGHGTVFIDRRRRRLIVPANAAIAARLAAGRSLLLFPEGTTFDGHRRGRFLTSHLACLRDRFAREPGLRQAHVQAIGLAYSDPAAAWIGDDTLLPHLWGVLTRPAVTCRLTYGAPMAVAPGFDRKVLGRTLADHVECLLSETPAPLRSAPGPASTTPSHSTSPLRSTT
jgi:1-acyl-sn-glycerol-3-phosphate acyltransferase